MTNNRFDASKIVNVTVAHSPQTPMSKEACIIVALCNDGTIWHRDLFAHRRSNRYRWKRMDDATCADDGSGDA